MEFTEQTLYLWFENYKKYKEYYNNKRIMESGVLNSEFIKQHIQRETELENKIEELERKLNKKSEISILNDPTDLKERLLLKLASCMSVSLNDNYYDDGIGSLNTKYYVPGYKVSISAVLSESEYDLLKQLNESLRKNYDSITSVFNYE